MRIKDFYQKIAIANDVTVEEVERDIKEAIFYSCTNRNITTVNGAYQASKKGKDEIPSVEEFIQNVLMETEEEGEI